MCLRDPLPRLLGRHRRHGRVGVATSGVPGGKLSPARHLRQPADQRLADPADPDRDAPGQAALPGIRERRGEHRRHGALQVRVGHHHQVVLRPGQRLHPLAAQRRALVDRLRHRRRADERDRPHFLVVDQRLDRLLRSVHDVQHPVREARLGEQLRDPLRAQRRALRGLQHHRVPGRDRQRQEPERDHRREVEGRDRGHHPERVAVHRHVDAVGDLLQRLALHQRRHRGGELDHLDPAPDLAPRLVDVLAVLAHDDPRQVVELALEDLLQLEHPPRPLRQRLLGPGGERLGGGTHGQIDFLGPRKGNPRQQLPVCGSSTSSSSAPSTGTASPPTMLATSPPRICRLSLATATSS